MRHWIFTLFILLTSTILPAQTPEGFTYQAVARDASGEILANRSVGMRISILQGSVSGTSVYSETHAETTNAFGLINLEIGSGTTSDSFSSIDWSLGSYYVKIEMDINGGTSYTEFGTSQLLSVPYALHAKTAGNTFSGAYSDLSGAPTILTALSELTNDSGFITDPTDADSDPNNEIQDISLSGTDLSISGGSIVDLSAISSVDTDDQTLSLTGTELAIIDGNTVDLSPLITEDSDDQLLTLDGTNLSIEDGNVVDLSSLPSVDTDDQTLSLVGTGLIIEDGNEVDLATLVEDADADPVNEIQDLHIETNVLSITGKVGATPVDLTPYKDNTDDQDLVLTENTLSLTNDATTVDLSGYLDNTDEQNLADVLAQGTDAGGVKIENLAEPTSDMDAATKAYVDELEARVASFEYAMLGNSNGMVLWNKLGSPFEVENSSVGPDGIIIGAVNFNNDVMYGKGATPNGKGDENGIDFPTTVADPERGTVEMWAEFYEPPVPGQYGVYGFVNSAHWTHNVVAFYWHNADSKFEMTLGFNGTVRGVSMTGFSPPLNEPVHLAFVWDRGGIDGSGDYMRVYVDGNVIATNTIENDWGTDNSSGNFRVGAPWDSNYSTDRYSLDNIKVWDHAKTNFGDRTMDGSITGTVQVESIDVNQITGLLGQGFTMNFPDILDNLVDLEITGITLQNKVIMVGSMGLEIERIPFMLNDLQAYNPGLSMESPVVFETTSEQDADAISQWFLNNPGETRDGSIIIKRAAGIETSRWNFYQYILTSEEAGIDGRTRFTLEHSLIPDNVLGCEWEGVNGEFWAYNPDTDILVEIHDVSHPNFCPQVQVDEMNQTITLTYDYNEGRNINAWVKEVAQGAATFRAISIIETTDGTPGTEIMRWNHFECFPIRFEHFYGFGLDVKLKTRVIISYYHREVG